MKLVYVKLENYIGIANGIGRNSIDIDFSKSKNSIIAIKGNNGSGKSTLLKALTPFPDESYNFIPGLEAKKFISYNLNGIIYNIVYIHSVKPDGTRKTTEGHIYKNNEDLNPNGNISSCKELIFNLFSLDNNFISLSQLSSEDRGLADKRPSERKKYINSILENLNVYNNMYKILSKKSSYIKSTINSINSKIASIGNKETLINDLNSIDKQIISVTQIRDELISRIGGLSQKLSSLDNGKNLSVLMNELVHKKVIIEEKLVAFKNKYKKDITEEGCKETINKLKSDILYNNNKIKDYRDEYDSYVYEFGELEKNISIMKTELESLSNYAIDDAINDNYIEEKNKELDKLKEEVDNIGLGYDSTKISNVVNVLSSVYDSVTQYFHTNVSYNYNFIDIKTIKEKINELNEKINNIEKEIIVNKQQISFRDSLSFKLNILDNRPKSCKINNCAFIEEALKAKQQIDELDSIASIESIKKKIDIGIFDIKQYKSEINRLEEYYLIISELYLQFSKITTIAKDLQSMDFIMDSKDIVYIGPFIRSVLDGGFRKYSSKIEYLKKCLSYVNAYNVLHDNYNKLIESLVKYNNYKQKYDKLEYELENAENRYEDIKRKMKEALDNLHNSESMLMYCTTHLDVNEKYLESILNHKNNVLEYEQVLTDIKRIQDDYNQSKKIQEQIEELSKDAKCNTDILTELQETRSKLAYSLTLLDDYIKELNVYDLEYNKI